MYSAWRATSRPPRMYRRPLLPPESRFIGATPISAGIPQAVRDLTVTFHRPKAGLRTKVGRALAGRVLVAPIGVPPEADRG